MSEREYPTAVDAAEAILDSYSAAITCALEDADTGEAVIAAEAMRNFEQTVRRWREEDAFAAAMQDARGGEE